MYHTYIGLNAIVITISNINNALPIYTLHSFTINENGLATKLFQAKAQGSKVKNHL